MTYRIEWEQDATEALDKLDVSVARTILRRVHWLSVNLDRVRHKALTGHLKGDFRLRAGDYRVVYSVNYQNKILIIRLVGHRSNIYKQ